MGKHAHHVTNSHGFLAGMKMFYAMQYRPDTEKSNLIYFEMLRLNADCEDTVVRILNDLAIALGVGTRIFYLVVIGDAQTYKRLCQVKEKYGSKLNSVLPYIGDWHFLLNYLHALMKLYKSIGLDKMVYQCHSGATARSVLEATSFDKTLCFLLEAWEAMYRHQLQQFIVYHAADSDKELLDDIASRFSKWIKEDSEQYQWENFAADAQDITSLLGNFKEEFDQFRHDMCEKDETFKFWDNFVHRDCLAAFGFYSAIQSGNWKLRNYYMKEMTTVFHIVGSTFYKDILLQHQADLLCFPSSVLEHFAGSGWVASFKGNNWSLVTLDEAHEMGINRDVKDDITSLYPEWFETKVNYLPVRAKIQRNLHRQLFPER